MKNSLVLSNPARIWTFGSSFAVFTLAPQSYYPRHSLYATDRHSTDGGGSSIISQLIIINEIMLQIQWIYKLEQVPRPCEYADLMVGSGLGGVISILLGRLRLTAQEALTHLIKLGQNVFTAPNESTNGPSFDVRKLTQAIGEILNDCGLSESTKMIEDAFTSGQCYAAVTAVPTSDLTCCRLLRTYRTPGTEGDCTIRDAILAAMALPKWFPPIKIGSGYLKEELLSGSVSFNNPTKKALEEAARMFGPKHHVSIIISFGSGQQRIRKLTNRTAEGLQEVLGAMVQDGGIITDDLAQRFANLPLYYQFSADYEVNATISTAWSENELGTIYSHTKTYMERISSSLGGVTKVLVENKGSHTISQLTQVQSKATAAKPLPRISPYYIDRDEVFGLMDRRLIRDYWNDQKLFVVYGMGGVGKTQSTSFFARKNRNRYAHVFFIDASSVESIKADLQSAIRSMGEEHSHDTFEDALQFLARSDNCEWLVIFDNADDPDLSLTSYLPKCDHGTVVITSRNRSLAQLAPTSCLHLQGMDESDSIQVLFKAARCGSAGDKKELESANALCKLLGGLPLALVQVGCYCDTTQILLSQYLERFKTHRSKLMETKPTLQLDEYSYSTYTSINLSYSLSDERAHSLLHLLAFFHHSSICLDIFQIAAKYKFTGNPEWEVLPRDGQYGEQLNALRRLLIPDGSWNDVHIDTLLQNLQKHSLISLSHSNDQTNVTLHPLVQSCILDTLSPEDYSLFFYMSVLVLSSCSRQNEVHLFQHLSAHIAEIESCNANIHQNDVASFAHILYRNGDYQGSMKIWERVKDECERVNGKEHRSTLRMSFWIGDCLRHLGKYEEAEPMIRRVVKTQETVLGEEDWDTLKSYLELGGILTRQCKTGEAENIFKRLLALYESRYGQEEHRRTFYIQTWLVDNLHTQRRYSEVEALLKSVLPVMKRALGEDDDIILSSLNSLSLALIEQGKWAEAEDISSEAVTKRTKNYGKRHPLTLKPLHAFGVCRFKRGYLDEADRILREVLNLRERILGKDHPFTIDTRNILGEVVQAQELLHVANGRSLNPQNHSSANDLPSIPDHPAAKSKGKPPGLERIKEFESTSPSSSKSRKLPEIFKNIWKSVRRK